MSAIFDKDPEEYVKPLEVEWTEEEKAQLEEFVKKYKPQFGDQLPEIRPVSDFFTEQYTHSIALHLYAQEVSKPVPVNADTLPDYEQIAKDCVARARETAPYLLQELGIVPTSVRQEEE